MKVISKTSEDPQYYEDLKIVERDYEKKIRKILSYINDNNFSDEEKLLIIYNSLVSYCDIEWNYMNNMNHNNMYTSSISYDYKGLKYAHGGFNGIVNIGSKYAPVLIGKGVCSGFSEAFKDIAQRVNVKVYLVTGRHIGFGHTWIGVYDKNNVLRFIDLYQGISDKHNKTSDLSFMMFESDLPKRGYTDYYESLERIKSSVSQSSHRM
jgi:transglutaminase/protease-like cytokinesis protein 3